MLWLISGLATLGTAIAVGVGQGYKSAEEKYYGPEWEDDPDTIMDNLQRGFNRFTTLDDGTKLFLVGILYAYYKFYEVKHGAKKKVYKSNIKKGFGIKGKNWSYG